MGTKSAISKSGRDVSPVKMTPVRNSNVGLSFCYLARPPPTLNVTTSFAEGRCLKCLKNLLFTPSRLQFASRLLTEALIIGAQRSLFSELCILGTGDVICCGLLDPAVFLNSIEREE